MKTTNYRCVTPCEDSCGIVTTSPDPIIVRGGHCLARLTFKRGKAEWKEVLAVGEK